MANFAWLVIQPYQGRLYFVNSISEDKDDCNVLYMWYHIWRGLRHHPDEGQIDRNANEEGGPWESDEGVPNLLLIQRGNHFNGPLLKRRVDFNAL